MELKKGKGTHLYIFIETKVYTYVNECSQWKDNPGTAEAIALGLEFLASAHAKESE